MLYVSDLGVGCTIGWGTESRYNAWHDAGTSSTRNKVASAKYWRKVWRHHLLCCPCVCHSGGHFLSTALPQDPDGFQKILWLPWKLWKSQLTESFAFCCCCLRWYLAIVFRDFFFLQWRRLETVLDQEITLAWEKGKSFQSMWPKNTPTEVKTWWPGHFSGILS